MLQKFEVKLGHLVTASRKYRNRKIGKEYPLNCRSTWLHILVSFAYSYADINKQLCDLILIENKF